MTPSIGLTADEVNDYFHSDYPSAADSGIRCEELGDGWAVARWAYNPAELRPGQYISGPTQFTLADTAIWFAVFTEIGIAPMAVTTDLSISFLPPAKGADLCPPDLDRVGRTRMSARGCCGWTAPPTVPFRMQSATMPAPRNCEPGMALTGGLVGSG